MTGPDAGERTDANDRRGTSLAVVANSLDARDLLVSGNSKFIECEQARNGRDVG